MSDDEALFFADPAAWREWLAEHHADSAEVWVGFYKRGSGIPSITWPESVDEALCFGWIDGLRKGIDETSYRIRFTPRKPTSIWSRVNVERVAALDERRLMQPAGRAAFARRREDRSGVYSFEQAEHPTLASADEARFRADAAAWAYFESRQPSYRRAALWWVVSAKREETRERRLATLIEDSRERRSLKHLARAGE